MHHKYIHHLNTKKLNSRKKEFKHKIDLSKQRRLYYSKVVGLSVCSECGLPLIEDGCTALIVVKADREETEFVSNLTGSHFCNSCPVVDRNSIELKYKSNRKVQQMNEQYFADMKMMQ